MSIPPVPQRLSNGILYASIALTVFLVIAFVVVLIVTDDADTQKFIQFVGTVFAVVSGFLGVLAKLQATQDHAEEAARAIAAIPDVIEQRLAAFARELEEGRARMDKIPCLDSGTPGVECITLGKHRKAS